MLYIVIPAYNEEGKINQVINGLLENGHKNIIVVDDGSDDKTATNAVAAGAAVIKHDINRGQGAALQTGNEYALRSGADIVVHFDADGQFNPADISSAVNFLEEKGLDIVLGSRFLDGRSKIPWTKKYIILPISRVINRLFTGLKLTDVHNGFRVLSKKALQTIKISQDRMAHNTDIVEQIKKKGLLYAEHPVEVKYFEYGQGIGGGLKILSEIFQGRLLK